ncbi:MAG TPA: archaetidylinositol phosphate synthase [Methanothermobacter sp.]|nr:CDP-alcohol phosphatidyltransferase [Methanothermobacter sp. MT-2]HHW04450.1 CDP-alcohol phosphatidyltransferase family protein [Methanothermobacter sp.]HOK73012.1 archaetidylinositol phosphate synthase [Methanothermobacter sp.]HOL69318.1 archaetidylinositol phosphate synthase [Methanothermobacter sp.]HPQ04536.1 archaetidylinositol phosphate synthase [Methanothermobacter sp.]
MLNNLRPYLEGIIDPILSKIKVNPNYVTLMAFIAALAAAYMFAVRELFIGGLLVALSGFMDIVDGALARGNFKATKFGGFLDSTLDRFSDASMIIGITYGGFTGWLTGMLALHASMTVSYVRARAEGEGIPCGIGVAERAERLIILIIGAFLASIFGDFIMEVAVILIIVLGYFTVAQRIYYSWRMMSNR